MAATLKQFTDTIFGLNPSFKDTFGSGLPGMAGSDIATRGGMTSGSEVLNKLRQETNIFAKLVTRSDSTEAIHQSANAIEGHLLTLQTLGLLSQKSVDSLIDDLHDTIQL